MEDVSTPHTEDFSGGLGISLPKPPYTTLDPLGGILEGLLMTWIQLVCPQCEEQWSIKTDSDHNVIEGELYCPHNCKDRFDNWLEGVLLADFDKEAYDLKIEDEIAMEE